MEPNDAASEGRTARDPGAPAPSGSALFAAMRPRQWVKNLFVFAALVFADRVADPTAVTLALAAFGVFSLLSSAAYLLNDVIDRDRDRLHPRKRLRAVASGRLPVTTACVASAALSAAGMAGAAVIGWPFLACAGAFLLQNVLYSLVLKRVALLDVIIVAIGFVLRAVAGGLAIDVRVSSWLLVCSFFLALFLAIGKRRSEIASLGEGAAGHRESLRALEVGFLDALSVIVTPCCILSYAIYTLASGQPQELVATVPIVVFGFFRYLWLVRSTGAGEDPTDVLWRDRPLQATVALWSLLSAAILHLS